MSSSLIIKKQNKNQLVFPLCGDWHFTINTQGIKNWKKYSVLAWIIKWNIGKTDKNGMFLLNREHGTSLREWLTLHSLSVSQGLISSVHDSQNRAVIEHRASNTGPDEVVPFKFEGVHHYSNADESSLRVHFCTQKNQQCNASCAPNASSVEVLGKPHKETQRRK